jgi:AcrR family transcriptional regulator
MTRVTQAHVDARTHDILSAARAVFAEKGVEGATMSDIARHAGISAGAIYRYFASKEDLLAAVFENGLEANRELFATAAARVESPMDALFMVGKHVLEVSCGHAGACLTLELELAARRSPGLATRMRELRLTVQGLIEDAVRRAQAAGEVDPSLDPKALALTLAAVVAGIQKISVELGETPDIEGGLNALRALIDATRPRGPA